MKIYRLYEEQHITISINEAWEFFSNPQNLSLITPPELNFIITNNPDKDIYQGMLITYKLRPLFNFALNWVSEITAAHKPNYFIDEQRFGPYSFWHHRHSFIKTPDGVLMKDEVYYSLPLGIIGRILHMLVVKNKLKKIFKYRKEVLIKVLTGTLVNN